MNYGFLNHLANEELGETGGKTIYALKQALYYVTHEGKTIIIPEGFQHDLASAPRIPIVYETWGSRSHREAVLHDYLYRSDSEPVVSRLEADEHFKMAMISRKQPWRIYYPMYLGVRLCGYWAYHKLSVSHKFIA